MEHKVAIVCDWLVTYAGAERVLEQFLEIYPEADVFCLVDFLPEKQRAFLHGKNVHTHFSNTCLSRGIIIAPICP